MHHQGMPTRRQQTNPFFPIPGAPPSAAPPARRRPPGPQPKPPEASVEASIETEEGVYIISVAARILHMHPQTLRKYERVGLVRPSRTIGMLRLYSEHDIAKLRMIKHLVDDLRLNLAGVEMALAVFDRLTSAMDAAQRQAARPAPSYEQAMREIVDMLFGHGPHNSAVPPKQRSGDTQPPASRNL